MALHPGQRRQVQLNNDHEPPVNEQALHDRAAHAAPTSSDHVRRTARVCHKITIGPASGLDWTAVRPPRLPDGPHTGRQVIVRGRLAPGFTVSRADLADTMLRAFGDPTTVGTTLGFAGR